MKAAWARVYAARLFDGKEESGIHGFWPKVGPCTGVWGRSFVLSGLILCVWVGGSQVRSDRVRMNCLLSDIIRKSGLELRLLVCLLECVRVCGSDRKEALQMKEAIRVMVTSL